MWSSNTTKCQSAMDSVWLDSVECVCDKYARITVPVKLPWFVVKILKWNYSEADQPRNWRKKERMWLINDTFRCNCKWCVKRQYAFLQQTWNEMIWNSHMSPTTIPLHQLKKTVIRKECQNKKVISTQSFRYVSQGVGIWRKCLK